MRHTLTQRPWLSFLLEAARTYGRVGAARAAAALSYFLILTLFPLLLCANYIIGHFHLDLEQVLQAVEQLLPASALGVIRDYLSYVAGVESTGLFFIGVATIVVSASAALRTLFHTMDDLYGVKNTTLVRSFLPSLVLSFLLMPTIYLSVVVIFTGDWFFGLLADHLPWSIQVQLPLDAVSKLWMWLRYLLLFSFMLLLLLVVYRIGTPRSVAGGRAVVLPALWTAVAMAVCSGLFSAFIGMSSRYALVYGSLASLIILLVWLYFCGNILMLGAIAGSIWQKRKLCE